MHTLQANFSEPEHVARYIRNGPPAFAPGHAGMLRMARVLLSERMPDDGQILVVGAGGGLEIRGFAEAAPGWRFVGVDPAPAMLDLARQVAGPAAGERLHLIEGTVSEAPPGPFDAATCILVLGLVPDDGSKQATLGMIHKRLKPGAPLVLVDQCIDRSAPDFQLRLDRYAAYALSAGVDAETVAGARAAIEKLSSMVGPSRNAELLDVSGFKGAEVFYVGMAWRGWVAYA